MGLDQDLAERLRQLLEGEEGLSERRMFGGLAFLIHGHMAVSASGQGGLLLRVDPDRTATLLEAPGTGPVVMRGREMAGWLRVERQAVVTGEEVERWAAIGVAYARSLPPK